MLQRIK